MDNDLISRSALLKDREYCDCPSCEDGGDCGFCYIPVEAVENAPAVDAVPVVRCKDCYYYEQLPYAPELGKLCVLSATWRVPMKEDDFCSCGERREDDEK